MMLQKNKIIKVNILHSDIQGYEFNMLQGARHMLENKIVDYLFISTHSFSVHNSCIEILKLYDLKYYVH